MSKLNTKKKELENLENKLKDAVEERDHSIHRLTEQMNSISAYLKTALDLESDINGIRVDAIKEQEI